MIRSRRDFLRTGLAAAAAALAPSCAPAREQAQQPAAAGPSPPAHPPVFQLSVFSDEISPDLDHALDVAHDEFGLQWVELRTMWDKNIVALEADEVARVRRALERRQMRVSAIAGPLFKVDWPGAPPSSYRPKEGQFGASYTFADQDRVLDRCLALANDLGTDQVRCFDFWRLDDPAPYRDAIHAKLREAARRAGDRSVTLVMENEPSCNSATLDETLRTLAAVDLASFKLNFDPGNAAYCGAIAYPDFYQRLPAGRIGHVHLKDVVRTPEGTFEWAAMGRGLIDYAGLFRALAHDGYHGALVLETHWRGAGSAEESTRQSMAGVKDLLVRAGTSS
jgi:sugar phosphate isomerase/epimerase